MSITSRLADLRRQGCANGIRVHSVGKRRMVFLSIVLKKIDGQENVDLYPGTITMIQGTITGHFMRLTYQK